MENIYDNGEMILGSKKDIVKYLNDNLTTSDMEEEIYEILEDLKDLEDNTIVAINYDCGMGYSIDYWQENDRVKEFKNE